MIIDCLVKCIGKQIERNNRKIKREQNRPAGVRLETAIPYMKDGSEFHRLNMYYPQDFDAASGERLPVIIDIHGGGHMCGGRNMNRNYCEYLASCGYIVMGMGYRLIPKTDLRGMIGDIFASMEWLSHCGKKRGCDLSRVFLTGDSAGGHLAMLVLCLQESAWLRNAFGVKSLPFRIRAGAISNGICDTVDYYPCNLDWYAADRMRGRQGHHAAWAPYINVSTAVRGLKLAPVLVIGSENDSFYIQTRRLLHALSREKINHEKIIWKKEDGPHLVHVFQVTHWNWAESVITNRRMLDFFAKNSI